MERCISNKEIATIYVYNRNETDDNNNGIAAALIEMIKKLFS